MPVPSSARTAILTPAQQQSDLVGTGLEYGVIGAMGPICGVQSLESLLRLNDLLNRLGLDAITTGNLIAWVMELRQRGMLDPNLVQDLNLNWGDGNAMITLIKQIVNREGLGAILADGASEAIEHFGPESARYLIWSKKLVQSDSVDLRAFRGFALGVATATRGAESTAAGLRAGNFPRSYFLFGQSLYGLVV